MDDPLTPNSSVDRGDARARHFGRQFSLLITSGLVNYAGALLLGLVISRSLGVRGLGAWAVGLSVVALISGLCLFGSDWILLRHGSYFHGIGDERRLRKTIHFSLMLGSGALSASAAVVFVLAQALSTGVFHSESLTPILRLAAVTGVLVGIRQILLFATQTFKDVKAIALVSNIVQPVLRLVFVTAFLIWVPSTTSAFVALVVAEILLVSIAAVALHRRLTLLGPTDPIDYKELLRFGLPAWGTRLAETLRGQMLTLFVGAFAAIAGAGYFSAARRIAAAPSSVNTTMNRVYTPMASDLYLRDKHEELAALGKTVAKWTFSIGFPAVCLMVVFPGELLSIFGTAFQEGIPVLRLLALGILFLAGTGPVTTLLMVAGRVRLVLADYIVVVIAELTLSLWLIPSLGATGAAVALLVGRALNNVVPLLQVWKILGIHVYRVDFWKPATAGIISVITAKLILTVIELTSPMAAGVSLVITGAIYLLMLFLFGFSPEERDLFQTLIRRARRSAGAAHESSSPADL